MAKVAWTEEAIRWLEDIFEHNADENPGAAQSVVSGIYTQAQILEEFPEAGYRYQASERNVRILLYGHFRIAYLIRKDRDVDILGVFHGALDITKYQL